MIIKKLIPKYIKNKILNEINKNYLFSGWNMQTKTCPPWKYINNRPNIATQIPYFQKIQYELENEIKLRKFKSNQFKENFLEKSKELMWRHYNVCLTINLVLNKSKKNKTFCEVGVADGITAWFALKTLKKENVKYNNFWLYDSWTEMKKKYLIKNDYKNIGKFNSNDLATTKKNLSIFKNVIFVKGFVPESFKPINNSPLKCDWLHIDLNSSKSTIETLNFFEKKLVRNSLILFDDFGWPSYETTRIQIEKWCYKKKGFLWPLPTGQAIYILK